jgi:hypothetical protein
LNKSDKNIKVGQVMSLCKLSSLTASKQSHYIEVAQGDIFMEQKMRFWLVLGRLAILKKELWANYEQLLRVVFSCFQGQKNYLKFSLKYFSVRTKKLHKMKVRKPKQIFKI